jgi:hypothetical protein
MDNFDYLQPIFNYFPHANPAKAGGVSVRVGDWKLIRWFDPQPGDPAGYELYNLRDDLGESKNLAAAEPEPVKELDALISLPQGATYPQLNPASSVSASSKIEDSRDGGGGRTPSRRPRAELAAANCISSSEDQTSGGTGGNGFESFLRIFKKCFLKALTWEAFLLMFFH